MRAGQGDNLFQRERFEAFVLALPAATLVHQWGGSAVGKVGGKIFAIHGGGAAGEPAAISFKCSDMAFELLPGLAGVRPAPYLARAKWVAARPGCALSPTELCGYIAEAHRLVAGRLPRRQRAQLGLAAL